jgi:hypothetical protein
MRSISRHLPPLIGCHEEQGTLIEALAHHDAILPSRAKLDISGRCQLKVSIAPRTPPALSNLDVQIARTA